jgi:hypothetical protein
VVLPHRISIILYKAFSKLLSDYPKHLVPLSPQLALRIASYTMTACFTALTLCTLSILLAPSISQSPEDDWIEAAVDSA